ncbi:PulJ/GspJ family protein [Pseudoteredinibacter isoporae]|uniref:PulJ/GspJ family protein n=1 Tax=Pseudoteredinibacter isoporae TaxID=570281 RepID=UPI00310A6B2A
MMASRQHGLTLIETLISLAILGLIAVAATQALQRASLLKDKIDLQSSTLQAQLTLEQLISRDILNSEALVWPSPHCQGFPECFELELKYNAFTDKPDTLRFIRYRFDNGRLYRDQSTAQGNWQTVELKHQLESLHFSIFRQQWQSVLDIPTDISSVTSRHNPDHRVRALRIHWKTNAMPAYEQTVMLP